MKSKKLPNFLIFNKNQNNFRPFIIKLYLKLLIITINTLLKLAKLAIKYFT
jgi:hypothetical protein